MTLIQRYFSGFNFVRQGWALLAQIPSLKYWIIMPLLIDLILLGLGIFWGTDQITLLTQKAITFILGPGASTYSNFLYYPLLVIFWLVFVVLYFYVVYVVASVVASPFYAVIADRVLEHYQAMPAQAHSWWQLVKSSFKMLWVSLLRGFLLLALGACLFVGSFIPGLNLLVGFVAFVVLAFDAADYALEVKNLSLTERMGFLRKNFIEFCGMGSFVGLTAFVPGLILLLMPFAVIGASAMVAKNTAALTANKV